MDIDGLYNRLTANGRTIPLKLEETLVYHYSDFEEWQGADAHYEDLRVTRIGEKSMIFALGNGYYKAGRGGNSYKFRDIVCLEMVGDNFVIEARDRLKSNWLLRKSLFWSEGDKLFVTPNIKGIRCGAAEADCNFAGRLTASYRLVLNESVEETALAVEKYLVSKKSVKEYLIDRFSRIDLGEKLLVMQVELGLESAGLPSFPLYDMDYFMKALSISNS